jgi:serine/threonine protein kinase/WD40 repeat protein
MTPDRFRQIEELYHSAREATAEERAALLAHTDPELRRAVERLLLQPSTGEFLDRLAIQNAPELVEDPTVTQISAGLLLGPYRIESKLGEGGMGEVFRAIDTRLERAVALKTTQERFSDRFKGEARTISSLNHPNICTLYDVGPNYFVMELVEGETIAARLKGGRLPVKTALSYALQIAAALKEAHNKGIIHRDLKPANIMIAKSGIKVLDFGLAKSGQNETLTASRMVIGTPAYMAPEQREGKPADARSDIYSFGCVLHEMLTGVRPASQRKRMPSRKLEKIVSTCLEQDPERRWKSAAELQRELTRLSEASPLLLRYAGVLLPIVLAAAGLAWYYRSPKSPVTVPSEFVQLTNFSDYATAPALSRDGRMVAFFRGGGFFQGTGQVYVKLLPDGESKQLTDDPHPKYGPVFTPDGSRVAYTAVYPKPPIFETWTVPVLGGPISRLMPNSAGLSWYGTDRIVFSQIMDGTLVHMGIKTARENRTDEHEVYFPTHERGMAHYSYPSPDQRSILLVEMDRQGTWQRCRAVPMDGSSAGTQVGPDGECIAGAWSPDNRWMYFNVAVDGSMHLWRQRVPDGIPEQITFGPTEEEGLAMGPEGKYLITSIGVRQSSVFTHDPSGDHPVSIEGALTAPKLSPDGKRLYYLVRKSNSTEAVELWSRDLASGKSDPLLTGQRIRDYDISPDQTKAAFTAWGGGSSQIFLAPLDRSSPPRLVISNGYAVSFGGGGTLIFLQLEEKAGHLARIQADGSRLEHLLDTPVVEKQGVSPDGEWAAVGGVAGGGNPSPGNVRGTIAVSTRDRSSRSICRGACLVRWSSDGKYLYVSTAGRATTSGGRTFVIPMPRGFALADLPSPEVDAASDEELAHVQVIRQARISPGVDPQNYAFEISAFQGNLFRIPLH